MSVINGRSLLEEAKTGEFQSFARFLTWLERAPLREAMNLPELLKPSRLAFRIGITGPPGAGKSTIVGGLLKELRHRKLRVGVLAVDPSSPFSRGAILGDRIRYSEHFLDREIFIRSLGTRGSLGGLSSAAFLMARAFDICGFDVLLIETVGVGQTELDVLHVADKVCVVLVPESGDSIQAMKAGLMEIADLFVVNKADRPGADGLAREIAASDEHVEVLKTVANEGQGIPELGLWIADKMKDPSWRDQRVRPERLREEAKSLLRREWEKSIESRLVSVQDEDSFRKLF